MPVRAGPGVMLPPRQRSLAGRVPSASCISQQAFWPAEYTQTLHSAIAEQLPQHSACVTSRRHALDKSLHVEMRLPSCGVGNAPHNDISHHPHYREHMQRKQHTTSEAPILKNKSTSSSTNRKTTATTRSKQNSNNSHNNNNFESRKGGEDCDEDGVFVCKARIEAGRNMIRFASNDRRDQCTAPHHNTVAPQQHNTITQQHHNTTTPQHHNTTTPQHHNTTDRDICVAVRLAHGWRPGRRWWGGLGILQFDAVEGGLERGLNNEYTQTCTQWHEKGRVHGARKSATQNKNRNAATICIDTKKISDKSVDNPNYVENTANECNSFNKFVLRI